MSCLYCPVGALRCDWCDLPAAGFPPRSALFPGATPTQRASALQGRHALGHAMPAEGTRAASETCGTCGHREVARTCNNTPAFSKCALSTQTKGKASDTRRRWPACARWVSIGLAVADAADEAAAASLP